MNYLLAVLTAVLLILAFPRFDLSWLAPVAIAPLLVAVVRESRPLRRLLLGYFCGFIYWFGVCYWIEFVLAFHGGLGPVVGWPVFVLFCLIKGLHMALFAFVVPYAMRTGALAIPTTAAVWVAIEVTHGSLGFAWLALGNAGTEMSLPMRLAPYTGVYGISFVFAMLGTALAVAVQRRSRRHLLWLVPLPLLILLPRLSDFKPGEQTAALVQPNISETEQWTDQSVEKLQRRLVFLSMNAVLTGKEHPPGLIVWPEVPAPLYADDPAFLRSAADLARVTRAHLLAGVVGHTSSGAPLNSAILVAPSGDVLGRYDKVHLVPFGEFVPWPFGFANKISTEIGDFQPGNKVVVFKAGDHRLATFICYESVFPNFVRQFAAQGAELLINISNDSWFDKSAARAQHLKIVRMRAAENQRWILRSTNDGITATIDPAGRLLGTVPEYVEAASLSGYSYIRGTTFYTRHGDWFPLLCGIFAAGQLLAPRFRRWIKKAQPLL